MAKTEIRAEASLDTTKFQRGLARTEKSIGKFVKNGISKFGALAGAAGLGMMAKSAIDLGSKISDMAVQMNIGTTELQTLEFAAREAGVEVEVMARALRNSQLRTQQAINGNKSYAEAFERLGINLKEFNALPTERKLEAIAIAQRDATDQAAAYNDVSRILGEKAGPAMQEVLQNLAGPKGYGGLEAAAIRAGEVMSKETIAKMDKAADEIESFKRMMTVMSGEILAKVIPALKLLGEGLGIIGDAFGTAVNQTGSFKDFLKSIAKDPKNIKNNYREMWKEMRKSNASFDDDRAARAARAKKEWADLNGYMVETSENAAKKISKTGVGGTDAGGGSASGGKSKAGGPMGMNIERGEYEARNDFIRRRDKSRTAHLTLNEKMRTQAMTGESAGITDKLVLAAQGGGTSANPAASKSEAAAKSSADSLKVIEAELTRTK